VARAVVRALERNPAEIEVAKPFVRLSAGLGQLSPAVSERIHLRAFRDAEPPAFGDVDKN
jgi:hypothetical protein